MIKFKTFYYTILIILFLCLLSILFPHPIYRLCDTCIGGYYKISEGHNHDTFDRGY